MSACEQNKLRPRIVSAIVGGSNVRDQISVPYVAAVGERLTNGSIQWFCGAAIVSKMLLVTAAHCLNNRKGNVVRIAATNLDHIPKDQDLDVESFTIHPDYSPPEAYHDIAVIRLRSGANTVSGARPICLQTDFKDNFEYDGTYVMGWGAEDIGGDRSSDLKQVKVRTFTNFDCDQAYINSSISPRNFPRGIIDSQICAGSSYGGKDSCQGDSGGPLVAPDARGVYKLIGIVSTGAGCGFKKYPGVYVRISSYSQWIRSFM